ncbi:AsmA family protein [Belnapia rosea]|uniref:Uncharacterized protein n=1 Tax=Belnapia rosea TaxID=938405 RepID=A0A1G6K9P0_9PROT|nr:hypothetical protein [Belnapia rosea]SDB17363.1 hypothetical protein SAMN02927895_00628 [Belnapia rosea]SDC27657.1 hypothetical protein SAMN04487779_1001437 [Belnapia rosea]
MLDAPVLHLRCEAGGTLSLAPGQPEGEAAAPASGPSPEALLAALRDLRITDGRIVVEDRALGLDWALRNLNLALGRPADDALRGAASVKLASGEETVPLRLAASLEDAPQRWHLDLSLPHLRPAALAHAAPALAPLGMLDAPASLTASETLTEDGQPLMPAPRCGPGRSGPILLALREPRPDQ